MSGFVSTLFMNFRSHSNSESSDGGGGKGIPAAPVYPEECSILHDMFPNTCPIEVNIDFIF